MTDILIIGAGLTNLCLAWQLEQAGIFNYKIFEKEDAPGGLLKSIQKNGFTFDHTGHFLHISNLLFKDFLEEVLGLGNCNKISRSSFIYSFERFISYPFQQNIKDLPKDIAFECFSKFIDRPKINNPKNFYDWVLNYFGEGFAKHFFIPYNEKLLNQKAKNITPSWTQRFVPDTSLKTLFDNLFGEDQDLNIGYNSNFYYPKRGGIYSLIQGILLKLKVKPILSEQLISINSQLKIATFKSGHTEKYKYLISTAPLPETLKNIQGSIHVDFFQKAASKLKCNSVINFNVGIDKKIESKKHWIYFPEKKYDFYRLGFWHNFGKNMAPSETSSFYGEISTPNDKLKNIDFKKKIVRSVDQIKELFGVSGSNNIFESNLILKYAYVLYDSWREKNLSQIHSLLQQENIFSIGRFGEWKYSSMQEAFLDGSKMAKILIGSTN